METITLNSHVDEDGILHLDIPVNMVNADLTITIILNPSDDFKQENKPKGKGWPANFFEETSGCLKDTPLTIDSECWVSFPQPNLLTIILNPSDDFQQDNKPKGKRLAC